MQINVVQLLKDSIGSSRNYQVDELDPVGRPVQGDIVLLRTDRGILVRARLTATVEAACSRCLAYFDYPVKLQIEEEYFPTVDLATGAALPLPEELGAFTIDDTHILDLAEAVRQYSVLAVPIKPLCRPDCAGLCPQCGYNLNRGPCHCPPPPRDPRWATLLAATGNISVNDREGT